MQWPFFALAAVQFSVQLSWHERWQTEVLSMKLIGNQNGRERRNSLPQLNAATLQNVSKIIQTWTQPIAFHIGNYRTHVWKRWSCEHLTGDIEHRDECITVTSHKLIQCGFWTSMWNLKLLRCCSLSVSNSVSQVLIMFDHYQILSNIIEWRIFSSCSC